MRQSPTRTQIPAISANGPILIRHHHTAHGVPDKVSAASYGRRGGEVTFLPVPFAFRLVAPIINTSRTVEICGQRPCVCLSGC